MADSGTPEMAEEEVGTTAREVIHVIGISVGPVKIDEKPLYVVLKRDGKEIYKLPPKITSEWRNWTLAFPLILERDSELTVKVLRKQRVYADNLLAKQKFTFDTLQSVLDSAIQNQSIIEYLFHPDPQMRLNLNPGTTPPETRMKRVAHKLKGSPSLLERTGKWQGPLVTLLEFGIAASEAHPFAKAALATVNVVYIKLRAQDEHISEVRVLVENMADMCRCIREVEQSAHSPLFRETIKDAGPFMIRVEKFVSSWASSGITDVFLKNFGKRELGELSQDYRTFRERFDRGVAVNVNASVGMLLKEYQDKSAGKLLKQLLPKGISDILPAARCLEGTREDILETVDTYLNNFDEPNLLWIRGHPGVGKSAIASTIVSRLDAQRRPALYFIFERARADITTPSALWRYVGYKLARWYPPARQCIVEQLQADEVRLNTPNSEDLFKCLVEQPLKTAIDVSLGQLPVIIIDGLDECGGFQGRRSTGRRELIRALKRWPQLSNMFKLVITSRPEVDITNAFRSTPIVSVDLSSGEAVTPQTSQDIRTFFTHHFRDIVWRHSELSEDWPGPREVDELTTRAAGLFIWAKTAVDFIDEGEPTGRLRDITSHHHTPGVGGLYTLILKTHYPAPTPEELRDFHTLASTMMLARRPLHDTDYTHLFGTSQPRLNTFRINLHSVLDRKDAHILLFAHQSFVDFLLNPHECPERFRIVNPEQNQYLVKACLKVMGSELRFNICNLKTSTLLDAEVPGIGKKVKDNIPSHLSYSCCFWAGHLSDVPFDYDLMKLVKELVEDKYLYWLEVMSLSNEMDRVDSELEAILRWSKHINDGRFFGFVKDARQFASAFKTPIAESAPHIYVSALAFAPQQSRIAQHFLNNYPRITTVTSGKPIQWSPRLFVTEYHKKWIEALTFSPDHRHLASCGGTTAYICDAENGNLILGPLHHSHTIKWITFSPNGYRIALGSGNGTVTICDTKSGDELLCFKGASGPSPDWIMCMAYSHDSKKVASYSSYGMITIWDVESNTEIGSPVETDDESVGTIMFSSDDQCVISGSGSGTVWLVYLDDRAPSCIELHPPEVDLQAVALSPNGQFMAGGSTDGIIYIWEIGAGNSPINTLKAHLGGIHLITYSTNSEYIVSRGRQDKTVRVWNSSLGRTMFRPLLVGSNDVRAVALSVNEPAKLAVGMKDGTVAMWSFPDDADVPGSMISQNMGLSGPGSQEKNELPLPGFPATLRCIAFSPCGKKVVSGSDDGIRVWDANTGEPLLKTVKNTRSPIISVVFSPDGKWIASLSRDGSICLWDSLNCSIDSYYLGLVVNDPTFGIWQRALAFSLDGRTLVSCTSSQVWISDMETMIYPVQHTIGSGTDLRIALSPDGTNVVMWNDENPPQIWSTKTRRSILVQFEVYRDSMPHCMAFAPSGKLVCSVSKLWELRVYDVATGKEIAKASLEVSQNWLVGNPVFSPDDRFIVVCDGGRGIVVFDVAACRIISGPWYGHADLVKSIAFSPDGSKIASCSIDGVIRIWDTSDFIGLSPSGYPSEASGPFTDECKLQNGWVKAPGGELLFWVPPSSRKGLYRPRNTVVIGEDAMKLDLTRFEYGDNWQRCKRSD